MTITYGTRTAIPTISALGSLASGAAKSLGKVDNTTTKAFGLFIEIEWTSGSAVAEPKSHEFFLLTAASDTTTSYTDRIDPASTSDVAASLKNALTVATARVDANSTLIRTHFVLDLGHPWPFWCLVAKNTAGSTNGATSPVGFYTPITY